MELLISLLFLCFCQEISSQTTEIKEAELNENQKVRKSLADVDCDTDDILFWKSTISRARTTPICSTCFVITGESPSYELIFIPLATLDRSRDDFYTVTLECRELDATVVKTILVYVRILPNSRPSFTELYVERTLTMASLQQNGFSVGTRCIDDDDDDTVTIKMESSSSSLFTLSGDANLMATGDLNTECNGVLTFVFSCQDNQGLAALQTMTLALTMQDANVRPSIIGLNNARHVPEVLESADSTDVDAFTVQDGGTSPECVLRSSNQELVQYFSLEMSGSRGTIKRSDIINYELLKTYEANLTVTCSDDYCTSQLAYVYVTINDVNEPIDIVPKDFIISMYEEATNDRVTLNPEWTPIDEDTDDTPTYSIIKIDSTETLPFTINPETGLITTTVVYDIDENAMATERKFIVQVSDQGGHSSTTTVTVTILDRNDNRPVFGAASSFVFTAGDCTAGAGTAVGTVAATDLDSDFQGNNVISYSVSAGPVRVDAAGNVVIGSDVTADTSYQVVIAATDAGQYPGKLSADPSATVTLVIPPCPTTAAPTTTTLSPEEAAAAAAAAAAATTLPPNTASGTDHNIGWVVVAALLGMTLLMAALWMTWRFCYSGGGCGTAFRDCCQPRPVTRLEVPRKPNRFAPKPGEGSFWREHYTDRPIKGQPQRELTPTPAPHEGAGLGPLVSESWR